MKKQSVLFCALLLGIGLAEASVSDVSDITWKQRWPFSDKIDVNFTLTTEEPQDILFRFDCAGLHVESNIVEWLDATVYGATNGTNHFVFDPAKYGVAGHQLPNLTFAPIWATNVSERLYLDLDLTTATYSFLSDTPEDGWTQTVYKTSHMPFRRVMKGTYTIGDAEDVVTKFYTKGTVSYQSVIARQVTLSSDYYIALFPLTGGQYNYATETSGTDTKAKTVLYSEWRGNTNGVDAASDINWPRTGIGEVTSSSFFGRVNGRRGVRFVMDLPTDAQLEVAIRSGTTTRFFNGGTASSTDDELKALWAEFSIPSANEAVGLRKPNQWNIYNPAGMVYFFCLDAVATTQQGWKDNINPGPSGLDPVGDNVATGDPMQRVCHGNGYVNGTGKGSLIGNRRTAPPTGGDYKAACRPVLHLADPRFDP